MATNLGRIEWVLGMFPRLQPEERREPAQTENTAIQSGVDFPFGDNHPLASVFGALADDPMWNDFQEALRRNREEDIRNLTE